MSWSITTQIHPADEIPAALDRAVDALDLDAFQTAQAEAAATQAKALVESGTIGQDDDHFSVLLQGHGSASVRAGNAATVTVMQQTPPDGFPPVEVEEPSLPEPVES